MDPEESGSGTDDDHDNEVKVKELRLAYRKKFGKLPQKYGVWMEHKIGFNIASGRDRLRN